MYFIKGLFVAFCLVLISGCGDTPPDEETTKTPDTGTVATESGTTETPEGGTVTTDGGSSPAPSPENTPPAANTLQATLAAAIDTLEQEQIVQFLETYCTPAELEQLKANADLAVIAESFKGDKASRLLMALKIAQLRADDERRRNSCFIHTGSGNSRQGQDNVRQCRWEVVHQELAPPVCSSAVWTGIGRNHCPRYHLRPVRPSRRSVLSAGITGAMRCGVQFWGLWRCSPFWV